MNSTPTTVGEVLEYLVPALGGSKDCPKWPPDVFAITATVLARSGAYVRVVTTWPPTPNWGDEVNAAAEAWEDQKDPAAIPLLRQSWDAIIQGWDAPINRLLGRGDVCDALVTLMATADVACEGAGIPDPKLKKKKGLGFRVEEQLYKPANDSLTLCKDVHSSRARVLPKQHTPQCGMALRNLSHNLALIPPGPVDARWHVEYSAAGREVDGSRPEAANILVLPWPEEVSCECFRMADPPQSSLQNMPPPFGFFEFSAPSDPDKLIQRLEDCRKKALEFADNVHMVVLPELAMTAEEATKMKEKVVDEYGATLVGGVRAEGAGKGYGRNYCIVKTPGGESSIDFKQDKHHRWCLDGSQIKQYGLQGRLSPGWRWWEHMELRGRQLHFVTASPWLTFGPLICEDLARQDPVGDIVRSVGPNLVIALLMDAPQLQSRWPARFATVLSEDPGSSVLTVTSLGMIKLSKPPPGVSPSRAVALWRDRTQEVSIELPDDKHALLLSVYPEWDEEWSADGRSDGKCSSYPILGGYHAV